MSEYTLPTNFGAFNQSISLVSSWLIVLSGSSWRSWRGGGVRDCETLYKHTLDRSLSHFSRAGAFLGLCPPGTPAGPCRGGETWTYASSEATAVWVTCGAEVLVAILGHSAESFGAFLWRAQNVVWEVRNLFTLPCPQRPAKRPPLRRRTSCRGSRHKWRLSR